MTFTAMRRQQSMQSLGTTNFKMPRERRVVTGPISELDKLKQISMHTTYREIASKSQSQLKLQTKSPRQERHPSITQLEAERELE